MCLSNGHVKAEQTIDVLGKDPAVISILSTSSILSEICTAVHSLMSVHLRLTLALK